VRRLIAKDPFLDLNEHKPWRERGLWPCSWVACPSAGEPPFVTAYRLRFTLDAPATIRAHVSADERYELFLDGEWVGRGPEQGSPENWFYETYDLSIAAGAHVLVARVWSLGPRAALAQMSVRPGFLFAPEGDWIQALGTGLAGWEARRLGGYSFVSPAPAHWRGANVQIDGAAFPWGFELGAGDDWQPAQVVEAAAGRRVGWEFPPYHLLHPAMLPPMLEQERAIGNVRLVAEVPSEDTRPIPVRAQDHLAGEQGWAELVKGRGPLAIPPHTTRRVIVDLENYYCAYPGLITSGGAGSAIRVLWAEALYHGADSWRSSKGHRDEIEGKHFIGIGDTFLPDGGLRRHFGPLWWQAGRYVELLVRTADQPLTIERFALRETRYPLEMESSFAASDPQLTRITPLLVRGMQMDAHEVFADCPYYEHLMYLGDTRLEALITYVMTRDDRLARKAMHIFDMSRLPSGLTQSRYPSRQLQIIAPYSLWWVAMIHDYALWRDDQPFVKRLMPGVRATIESFQRWLGPDGLLYGPEGWNMMDWVPEWEAGIPPDGIAGASGLINWQLAYALTLVADLEAWQGEPELARRAQRQASELAARLEESFWDQRRGLFADDLSRRSFSEHTQCMAILSGLLDPQRRDTVAEGLLRDGDLARTTIYFSHYLFETYRAIGSAGALFERMQLWFDLAERGLKTTIESPEPTRSDCHAWGAHPLYHYFATILGIRPGDLGFRTVVIAPQLGPLTSAGGRLVHPRGEISVDVRIKEGSLSGSATLPPGVTGTFIFDGKTRALREGSQELHLW
jgi:alpha-L-rhamnosidase